MIFFRGKKLRDDYKDVSEQFADVFNDLRARIAWRRRVLGGVLAVALIGLAVAVAVFFAVLDLDG